MPDKRPDKRPDFDAIRINAARDKIDLSEITILYEDLTLLELRTMEAMGLIARKAGK